MEIAKPRPGTHDTSPAAAPTTTSNTTSNTTTNTSSNTPPPFWQSHHRSCSTVSYESLDYQRDRPPPITLADHTFDGSESSQALWAKGVVIDGYVMVSGSSRAVGSYVVYNCTVETLDGGPVKFCKRYSQFDQLRAQLLLTFPDAGRVLPPLPPKSVVSRFRPRFLEKRREGLTYFLNCVLLNPQFAGSPLLKDFIFS